MKKSQDTLKVNLDIVEIRSLIFIIKLLNFNSTMQISNNLILLTKYKILKKKRIVNKITKLEWNS